MEFNYKTTGFDGICFFNKSGGVSFYSRTLRSTIEDITEDKLRFVYDDESSKEVEQNAVLCFLTINNIRYVVMMPERGAKQLYAILRKCYYNYKRVSTEFDSILSFKANLFSREYGVTLNSENVLLWMNNEKNEFVSTGITVKMEYFKEVEQFSITEFRVQAPKDLQESEFRTFCNNKLHEIAFANRQQFYDDLLTTPPPIKKKQPAAKVTKSEKKDTPPPIEDYFHSISGYKQILKILIDNGFISELTLVFIDSKKGSLKMFVAILKSLHQKGYLNKSFTNEDLHYYCKTVFKISKISLVTVEKAKANELPNGYFDGIYYPNLVPFYTLNTNSSI